VEDLDPELRLAMPAPYARRNFAVAIALADAVLGSLDPVRVREVAEGIELPGRMQVLPGDPPLILDAAHNPDGARALAEALPEAAGDVPVVACLAMLADKDAIGIVDALAPRLELAICAELPAEGLARVGRPGARSLEAAALAEIAAARGLAAEIVEDPEAALRRALTEARDRGGVALATGSHYLLKHKWTERHAQSSSR
jgi:dihydrofolate synthase/folylpolyglutamate synthase